MADEVVLLTQGTKEYLLVDVDDLTDQVTTLTGTNPVFDVFDSKGLAKYSDQACVLDPVLPMRVRCMIDTSTPEYWATGDYKLFLQLETMPEEPRIGPFLFVVID